jgi:hypothetical protein
MKRRIVRSDPIKFWILFPALLGMFAFINFMSINDVIGTALLFFGVVFVGFVLGYFVVGNNMKK